MNRVFIFCIITLLSVCCISCGRDNEFRDDYVNNQDNSNSSGQDDKWGQIPNYISASVSLENYTWHIVINTRLKELFPAAKLEYGIVFTYDDIWIITDLFDADLTSGNHIEKIINRNSTKLEVLYPLFATGDYNEEFYYWEVYMDIKEKINNGETLLGDTEKLYDLCLSKLAESARKKIQGKYSGHIFVTIDGFEYKLRDIYY